MAESSARNQRTYWTAIFLGFFFLTLTLTLNASDLDTIGLTQLLAAHPGLNASGAVIAQPEAGNGTPAFEIDPAAVSEPEDLFTWISTNGSSTVFPNDLGTASGHAALVADHFFASGSGVATGASHVDNYDADYFLTLILAGNQTIADTVVNQSFIDGDLSSETGDDNSYDNYVATHGTIFCSSVGNGGNVYPPSTAYNVLGVGCYGIGAQSSVGPAADGRSKPDLVGPGQETSFSTPYVSGAAALLLEAANGSAAADVRAIKALLINGAIKPFGWTHTATAPLDTRYGAGLLNVFYSYNQFAAGQRAFSSSDSSSTPENSNPSAAEQGWDFQSLPTSLSATVNHYCFNVSNSFGFTFTATLVWNRALAASGVNQITLTLCNFATGALVAQSISSVDNVQHIYVPVLPSGKYDLQIARGAALSSDAYALAFQFYPISPVSMSIASTGNNAAISWPATPTIYTLQETGSLVPPISWNAVPNSQLLTNGLVLVNVPAAAPTFYRLIQ
jgi:hypothetical protein